MAKWTDGGNMSACCYSSYFSVCLKHFSIVLLCYKIRIKNISYEEIIKYNNPFQTNLGAFQILGMV